MTAALVWSDELARYRFRPDHPLNPRRLELTVDLIRQLGLLDGDATRCVPPRDATDAELRSVHDDDYLDAVRHASVSGRVPAGGYGLGTGDVPVVPGMHEMARRVVGSTLTAAELVATGRVRRAFSIAGGLHHATARRAAGFCVYNDLAVAIRWLQREHGHRVLYVDFDAHHGDGVQDIFYADPDVLTLSIHESGLYLFPGTGFIDELGEGDGHGYAVNVPLEAGTGDDSFLAAFDAVVPAVARAFQPSIIVLQAGCDAHVWDPLTHLRCTTALFETLTRQVAALADELCHGRLVATGGGGYAIHSVVPRAWTLTWAALAGMEPPDAIPETWMEHARPGAERELPRALRDPPDLARPTAPERADSNRATVRALERRVLPLLSGWGLAF